MRARHLALGVVAACVVCGGATSQVSMDANACANAKKCTVRGSLEISNDGHAYIGKLTLPDRSCINVSLPLQETLIRLKHPPETMTVTGVPMPYPHDPEVFSFEVNGRKVGYGTCPGDFYLFVF
jgi:hypothetical protein